MDLLIKRDDIRSAVLNSSAPLSVADGEIIVEVARFSFTANNVSYAVAGESAGLEYFKFYPHNEDLSVGRIPVWGLGIVAVSRCPGVAVGEKLYGFFTMSRYVVLKPVKVSKSSFHCGAAHRKGLAATYNTYERLSSGLDPFYKPQFIDLMLLFRPLYLTSWLLNDFFLANKDFDAKQAVLISASSKTSYGLAFLLKQRGGVKVVGLTSPSNVAFCESMGVYDQVLTYDNIASEVAPDVPAYLVDMSGNFDVLQTVHTHMGSNLKYSCVVGTTHWETDGKSARVSLPGPKRTFFFAPAYVATIFKERGVREVMGAACRDYHTFMSAVSEGGWCNVLMVRGAQNVREGYVGFLNARASPTEGTIMSLWDEGEGSEGTAAKEGEARVRMVGLL